jgi:hypothetical protein
LQRLVRAAADLSACSALHGEPFPGRNALSGNHLRAVLARDDHKDDAATNTLPRQIEGRNLFERRYFCRRCFHRCGTAAGGARGSMQYKTFHTAKIEVGDRAYAGGGE